MNIKKKKKQSLTDLDVGSLSDIAFLLIIFFILTTQIANFTGHMVTIPSGAPPDSSQEEQNKQITINIASDLSIKYTIGKEELVSVSLDGLKTRLIQHNFFALEPEKRLVILDSEGTVPYEMYYKVAMIIADAGGVLTLIDYAGEKDGGGASNG